MTKLQIHVYMMYTIYNDFRSFSNLSESDAVSHQPLFGKGLWSRQP